MSSPAQRYQDSKARSARAQTRLGDFQKTFEFELDEFQLQGCAALEAGRGVLVAAPTGSGKTIVGEFAIYLALARGLKAFYTTPIKALSNQKYGDLAAKYGAENVGLLTGDTNINPDAPVIVMTTEVLRNMLYAGSEALDDLAYVVMDEVHYLADRFRGAVWEEVIIHLPSEVQLASLSATVSNAEEFGAWLDTVRGDTDVIVTEHRPVPLWQHVMVGRDIVDLFASDTPFSELPDGPATGPDAADPFEVNPELTRLARSEAGSLRGRYAHGTGRPRQHRGNLRGSDISGQQQPPVVRKASRAQVITALDRQGLLPAITFIFSRAGCDAAVKQCADAGLWLTTEGEQREIAHRVDEACREIPADDLDVLGYWNWRDGLVRGLAAHHAGMLPTFKEVVEQLFADGLVRAVFATETLALGVNMPARSVVLEKLDKFNGEAHVAITAGEYTQLTGRAGRRGIDVEGHAVVLWQPGTDPAAVAGLASRRTYPLNSSFRPTYNMSMNLLAQFGRPRAREILESSFAQFQADRSVVGLARQVRSREESLAGYAESMHCHLGDFGEYARMRRELTELENTAARGKSHLRRSAAEDSLDRLRPGDVVDVPGGRTPGVAVVVSADASSHEPRPTILTLEKQIRRLSIHDLAGPITPVTRIRIPKVFNVKLAKDRRDLCSAVRHALTESSGHSQDHPHGIHGIHGGPGRAPEFVLSDVGAGQERAISEVRRRLRAHPCHGCSDRESHARWSERWWTLRRETDGLLRQIQGRTNTIAKTFDRVCEVLSGYGYLEPMADGGLRASADGQRLRRIYGEKDLLVSLCLRDGVFYDLDAAELATLVCTVVYQAKRDDRGLRPRMPSVGLETAVDAVVRQWSALEDVEEAHKLPLTGEPELGLVWPMYKWARGRPLQDVLEGTELAAGDFVRWAKQVIDLLDQIAKVPGLDPPFVRLCIGAIGAVRRGVVAYSAVVE